MIKYINQRPWLYIVAAFVALIASWAVLLHLAAKYAPQTVPLKTNTSQHGS